MNDFLSVIRYVENAEKTFSPSLSFEWFYDKTALC